MNSSNDKVENSELQKEEKAKWNKEHQLSQFDKDDLIKDNTDISPSLNKNNNVITITSHSSDNKLLIDQIFDNAGYSYELLKLIFIVLIILMMEGLHNAMIGILIIPLKEFYHVSNFEITVTTAFFYVFLIAASWLMAPLLSVWDRIQVLLMAIFTIFLTNFFLSTTVHFVAFAIYLVFSGMAIGLIIPLIYSIIAEYLPMRLRSFVLSSLWTGFNVGVLYVLSVTTIIMPKYEPVSDLPKVLIWCAVPSLVCAFLVINFVNDSPRSLILRGKFQQAFKYLEKLKGKPLTEEEKYTLRKETREGANDAFEDSNISSLFSPYIAKSTIISLFVCFSGGMTVGIPMLIQSITLKKLNGLEKNLEDIIPKLWTFHLIHFPANIIGGALTEVPFLGRKLTISVVYNLAGLLTFISFFFPEYFEVFLGLELLFINAGLSVFITYLCEVYPTKIRTTAQGFFAGFNYIAIFCSQFIAVALDQKHVYAPYILSCLIAFMGGIAAIFLPFETYGQPIDILFEDTAVKIGDSNDNNFEFEKVEFAELPISNPKSKLTS